MGDPVDWQGGNAFDMQARKQEHVDIQGSHEEQHGEEHGDKADNDSFTFIVDNEHDATDDTSNPNNSNQRQGFSHTHDAVVTERVENGNVPVDGYDQKVAYGGNQRDTDHWVKDIVHVLDEPVVDDQVPIAQDGDHDGLQGIGHTHEDVCSCQATKEEVHGRMEVSILDHSKDNQDILQKADDPQGQEDLCLDGDLFTEPMVAPAAVKGWIVDFSAGGVQQHWLQCKSPVSSRVHCQSRYSDLQATMETASLQVKRKVNQKWLKALY